MEVRLQALEVTFAVARLLLGKEDAEAPAADAAGAEGAEGAPVKKKMAGKTLVLFVILPAVLVLGGGGAAAMMLMGGGGAAATEAHAEEGEHPAPEDGHGEEAAGDHGAAGGELLHALDDLDLLGLLGADA